MGAEARIYEAIFMGEAVICKERIPKEYRDPAIDLKLRKERTIQEVRVLRLAFEHSIPVPRILDVDKRNWTIVMENIHGLPLKTAIDNIDTTSVFTKIGKIIAELHQLNIIHGDLTTSNIIIKNGDLYFIDFGLSFISTNIEDRAVDLLVIKHTLESSHAAHASDAFQAILQIYTEDYPGAEEVIDRLSVVENRVRYRSHSIA